MFSIFQVVQWQDAKVGKVRKRFLLKSPGYMNTVKELVKVFPDAKVIQTYREPTNALISLAYLLAYMYGLSYKEIDLEKAGQFYSSMIHEMFEKHKKDRDAIRDRSFIANFSDYQKDNAGFMKKALAFLSEECGKEDMKPILDFLHTSKRFNKGRIRYEMSVFGWELEEIEKQFVAYKDYLV